MSVSQVKQAVGSWNVRLRDAPQSIIDGLQAFGHIAIIPGSVNVSEYEDALLAAARYVGVYRSKASNTDGIVLHGVGLESWLGDEQGNGDVFETAVELDAATFADTIAALLPPGGAITLGSVSAVAGTFTGRFQWTTSRKALDYATSIFGAEWKVNNDGTLNAGLVADLYVTTPRAILVSNEDADDLRYKALPGRATMTLDNSNFTTRVVVLGEGEGETIVTGSADTILNPFKDLHGNDLVVTRLVSESFSSSDNVDTRADVILEQFSRTSPTVTLSTSRYDIKGDVVVGDYIYVYDRARGFYDDANEVTWEGEIINPVALRVVELSWPIRDGWTVAFRDGDGNWSDLSPYVHYEGGDTNIVVGDKPQSIAGGVTEPVGTRPAVDSTIPAPPVFTAFNFGSYQSGETSTTKATVRVTWTTPLNSNGSLILDGSHYEIRYRVSAYIGYNVKWGVIGAPAAVPYKWGELLGNTWGAPISDPVEADPEWHYTQIPWGTNETTILELTPAVSYEFQIRALDTYEHQSPYSTSTVITTIGDMFAPSTPAAPIVAASRIAIEVIHLLGKASGGTFNLEQDMDHLEVHVGGSESFYPDDSTMVGKLTANTAMIGAEIPAVGKFNVEQTDEIHVKVRAVDRSGNKSGGSESATVTADLIDNAHISDLSVSKLTAGTITANSILAADIEVGTGGNVIINEGALVIRDALGRDLIRMGLDIDSGLYGYTVRDPDADRVVVRAGELESGGYGLEAVNTADELVSITTLAFGTTTSVVATRESTTSGSYTNLATLGPSLTVEIGSSGRCIVIVSCYIELTVPSGSAVQTSAAFMSYSVDGPTPYAALDARAAGLLFKYDIVPGPEDTSYSSYMGASRVSMLTGLTPGTYTFNAKYNSVNGHAVYFSDRVLVVLPY